MSPVPTPRRVGRPRSTAADDAIRVATIEVFAESGYEGLRIESVAERGGVAKSTLYRRFPCKTDLVQHALSSAIDELACPHTGSLVEDLFTMLQRMRDKFVSDTMGRAVPALVDAAARHPDLRELHRRFIAERRRSGLQRLTAAVDSGDLPDGTDAELLMDQLGGPVFYRSFVSGGDLSDATLRLLVARTLDGYR